MQSFHFRALIFSLLLFSCASSHQLFPKKYLGNYQGTQEAYELMVDGASLAIPSAQYELVLEYGTLYLITPRQNLKGSYHVTADTKMYYALKVKLENGVIEEWQLWKKGKRLIRKPSVPQPEMVFIPN